MVFEVLSKLANAHQDAVWTIRWGVGSSVYSGSADESIINWVVDNNGLQKKTVLVGHVWGVVGMDLNREKKILASSSIDSSIRIWNLNDNSPTKTIDASPVEAWALAIDPTGERLASSSRRGNVILWNIEKGEKEGELEVVGNKFSYSVAYSPDGKTIASGLADGIVNIFETETGKKKLTLEGHAMPVRSLVFSSDNSLLFTACDDKHINVYDNRTAELVTSLSGHNNWVVSVQSNGKYLASASTDKTVKLWDFANRQCVHTYEAHTEAVWCVAFNEEGTKLASGGDDNTIAICSCT